MKNIKHKFEIVLFSQFYSTMALIYLFQHKQNIYLCDGPYKYLARPNWKFRQNCYWVITLFKYISSLFNIAIWKTRIDFVTYYFKCKRKPQNSRRLDILTKKIYIYTIFHSFHLWKNKSQTYTLTFLYQNFHVVNIRFLNHIWKVVIQ